MATRSNLTGIVRSSVLPLLIIHPEPSD
jgi:hypothetical protein